MPREEICLLQFLNKIGNNAEKNTEWNQSGLCQFHISDVIYIVLVSQNPLHLGQTIANNLYMIPHISMLK